LFIALAQLLVPPSVPKSIVLYRGPAVISVLAPDRTAATQTSAKIPLKPPDLLLRFASIAILPSNSGVNIVFRPSMGIIPGFQPLYPKSPTSSTLSPPFF
jgi:hypothetical protein